MSAVVLPFPVAHRDYRYEVCVWLLRSEDHTCTPPRELPAVWEVARCPWHMDWIDPLQTFPEDQRDAAIAWAAAYAASRADHVYHGRAA